MLRYHSPFSPEQRWASLALHILPNVLAVLAKTRNPTPIRLLEAAKQDDGAHAAARIVRVACLFVPYVSDLREKLAERAQAARASNPSKSDHVAKLARRITYLATQHRICAAARTADEATALLDSDLPLDLIDSLSVEQAKELIASLNPAPSRKLDELPPIEADAAS